MAFHFIPSLLLTLSLLSITIHAQDKIRIVASAAYARAGSKLYVVGGTPYIGAPSLGQTIVLNFSTTWDAASPAWTQLQNGPDRSNFTGALSANGSTFITLRGGGTGYARLYDVATDRWSASKIILPEGPGLTSVTDPTSNKAYIPIGGQMYIYDFASDTTSSTSMVTSPIANWMYFQGAWWSTRNSILFFGGYSFPANGSAPVFTTSLYMYTPWSNTWSPALQTRGDAPSPRADMCVVTSDDGSTLIVFGGRTDPSNIRPSPETEVFSSDIFVLDLATMIWTRAPDSGKPRIHSVCTLYNGIFFSWGGVDGTGQVVLDSSAILYDVKKKTYLTSASPSSGLSTGGIIGIAVGGVAVIVLAALIAWSVRRRKRSSGDGNPPPETTDPSPEYYSGYQKDPLKEHQQSPHQQAYSQYRQQPYHQASSPMQSYPLPPGSLTSSTQYQGYAQQQGYHDYPPASYNSKDTAPRGPEAITVFDGSEATVPRGPEALLVDGSMTAVPRGPEALLVDGTFQAPHNPHS
ncbi:MAG: hypothetical protein J3Q66DRAFT_437170 [Benniella sp.]|nr:MAG: hypothetical protein J3Q66DRAFT_437170 [Benniella sp.]